MEDLIIKMLIGQGKVLKRKRGEGQHRSLVKLEVLRMQRLLLCVPRQQAGLKVAREEPGAGTVGEGECQPLRTPSAAACLARRRSTLRAGAGACLTAEV